MRMQISFKIIISILSKILPRSGKEIFKNALILNEHRKHTLMRNNIYWVSILILMYALLNYFVFILNVCIKHVYFSAQNIIY